MYVEQRMVTHTYLVAEAWGDVEAQEGRAAGTGAP